MVSDLTTRGPRVDLERVVHSVFALSLSLFMRVSSRYPGFLPQPTDSESGGLGSLNFPQERMGVCVFICQSVLAL